MSQAAECGKETDLRFVETIKVQFGRAQALPYHQAKEGKKWRIVRSILAW